MRLAVAITTGREAGSRSAVAAATVSDDASPVPADRLAARSARPTALRRQPSPTSPARPTRHPATIRHQAPLTSRTSRNTQPKSTRREKSLRGKITYASDDRPLTVAVIVKFSLSVRIESAANADSALLSGGKVVTARGCKIAGLKRRHDRAITRRQLQKGDRDLLGRPYHSRCHPGTLAFHNGGQHKDRDDAIRQATHKGNQ